MDDEMTIGERLVAKKFMNATAAEGGHVEPVPEDSPLVDDPDTSDERADDGPHRRS